MKTEFIIALVVFSLILLLFLFVPSIKRLIEFKYYKKNTGKVLYKYASDYDVFLLNDVNIPYGDEIIRFDHILFGNKFIYCIKDECHRIGLEGSAEDLKWFSYDYISNPFKENNLNIILLSNFMKINIKDKFFYSIVCVNDSCLTSIEKCKDDEIVCNTSSLYKRIKELEQNNSVSNINQERLETVVKMLYERIQTSK